MIREEETVFMRMAIEEAKGSTSEDGRTHPLVGAVVVVNGCPHSAHRGETGLGDHAEEGLLEKKLPDVGLHGSTVYTTLEPCTKRNRLPCAEILSDRKVARVVIGMLDPDQRITGKGVLHLRRHGIAVDLFPSEMMRELESLNRRFLREKEADSMRILPVGPFRSRMELPKMSVWPAADAAKDILMIGQNLYLVFRQWNFFEQKLRQKCNLRLLIADPDDDTLITTMSRGVVEQTYTKADFQPVLDTIRQLRNALPEQDRPLIELRVMDYVPTLSFQVLDGTLASGTIIIELAPNKMEVLARPHVMLRASEPTHQEWYQKFLKNCEDMFDKATPWRWE